MTCEEKLTAVIEQRDYYYSVIKQILAMKDEFAFFTAAPYANRVIELCRDAIDRGLSKGTTL